MERAGRIHFRLCLEWTARPADLDWADVVVFCRNQEPVYGKWLAACQARGLPCIYDLDDNFFAIPADYDFKAGFQAEQMEMVQRYLRAAALVRVYSERMVSTVQPFNPAVEEVASTLDWDLIQPPRRSAQVPVRLVYATSRVDDRLAGLFLPAAKRLLREYGPRVELHLWGYNPPEMRAFSNVHFKALTLNYDHYLRSFSAAGFDIGLAPLLDDEFHNSKTNTKYREYGAAQVAGIYSDTELYRRYVQPGETGLLVANHENAWYAAMLQLVEDANLRTRIQQAAQTDVRARYSEQDFEAVWLVQLTRAAQQRRQPEAAAIASQSKVEPASSLHSAGRMAQIRFQLRRAFTILRSTGLKTFFQRASLKLGQVGLLIRLRLFKRL